MISIGCIYLCILCVSADFCEEQWQVKIDDDPSKVRYDEYNGLLDAINMHFENSSYKKIGKKYILCPCHYVSCMHRCSSKFSLWSVLLSIKKWNIFLIAIDLDVENGASFEAIKQAVHPKHHYTKSCIEENCPNKIKEGFKTVHDNSSKNFFDLIYTIDEPFKFYVKRLHDYTVKANEPLPIEKYDTKSHYCFTVENEVTIFLLLDYSHR